MRYSLIALAILLCPLTATQAQVGIHIELPGIDIGINVPAYPRLVLVPGYPVYYDPQANSNYFFYDGLYWVYQSDNWYASSWYNGPWDLVRPGDVPVYLLRVPVRYYRHPPSYFRGWRADAPPRWGEHWGNDWEKSRTGWDQWDHRSAPAAAPLPAYQRQYSGSRYPRAPEQQGTIRAQNYRYQPRESVTQQHFQQHVQAQAAPGGARAGTHPQATVPQQPPPSQQHAQPAPQQQQHPQPAPQQQQHPQPAPQQQQHAQPTPQQQQHPQPTPQQQQHAQPSQQRPAQAPQERGDANRKGGENKADQRGKGQENDRKEEHDPARQ